MKRVTITLVLKPGTAGELWIGEASTTAQGTVLHVEGYHALVIETLRGFLAGHDQMR